MGFWRGPWRRCLAWQREGLDPPACVQDATQEYFESEDALGRWLDERCVRTANAKSLTSELFTDWKQWAEASGGFMARNAGFLICSSRVGLRSGATAWAFGGFRALASSNRTRPLTPHTPTTDRHEKPMV